MKALALALALLPACSAPSKTSASTAPAGAGSAGPAVEFRVITDGAAPLPCDGNVTLGVHGLILMADGSPAAGVTVVVKVADAEGVGITDEHGCYAIATKSGSATIYVFYADVSHQQATAVPSASFGRVDATINQR